MVGHLSIFNSNKLLVISILLFIGFLIIGELLLGFNCTQFYYGKNIAELIAGARISKKPTCIILGDSRAESGIVPEILSKNYNYYSFFNFASPGGGIVDEYSELIKINDLTPSFIIFAVSPLDTFEIKSEIGSNENIRGRIKLKIAKYLSVIQFLLHPAQSFENKTSLFIQRRFRSYHGLNGLLDLIIYGEISQYYSPAGWNGIVRLGSDELFTREVNRYYYQYNLLESNKNSKQIEMNKFAIETIIQECVIKKIRILFVRLPVSSSILNIENDKYPWFNQYFETITNKNNLKYYDANIGFNYSELKTDGSHLSRSDACRLSKNMANLLRDKCI